MSEDTSAPVAGATQLAEAQAAVVATVVSEIVSTVQAILELGGFDASTQGSENTLRYLKNGDQFYREVSVSYRGDMSTPVLDIVHSGEDGSRYAERGTAVCLVSIEEGAGFGYDPNEWDVRPQPVAGLASLPSHTVGMLVALTIPSNYVSE